MYFLRYIAGLLLFTLMLGGAWANSGFLSSWDKGRDLLEASEIFSLDEILDRGDRFEARGTVANGYYIYAHSLKLVDQQGIELSLSLSPGKVQHDEFFGDTEIYKGDSLFLSFPETTSKSLVLHWQGCAEVGVCYAPHTLKVNLPVNREENSSKKNSLSIAEAPIGKTQSEGMGKDQQTAKRLEGLGPIYGVLLFLGFGLLLAFTPCTLPMIPIVSSMVVGSQAKPSRAFVLTLFYIVSMAVTYSAIGVGAGLAGANLQATLQSPWLLSAFAALFLILASALFGLFSLSLPSALMSKIETAGRNQSGGSVVGAAALGFLSALLVGPCMTAPLAGALLYIGQTGSAVYGGFVLFALGIGMGLPLLALATFGAHILPKPGLWMERVNITFGYLMVGMAVMMLSRFLPATLSLLLWGAWVLSVAIGLLALAQDSMSKPRIVWLLRTGAAFLGLWAVFMLLGAASGGSSALQPLKHLVGAGERVLPKTATNYVEAKSIADVDARLKEASVRGEWTLIDFYADWCISCHIIESKVFGDPLVAERLRNMQIIRPDVTLNDLTDRDLLQYWNVMGPPTMILVGPDGNERRDLRMIGEINSSEFIKRLDKAARL